MHAHQKRDKKYLLQTTQIDRIPNEY